MQGGGWSSVGREGCREEGGLVWVCREEGGLVWVGRGAGRRVV